jgi:hypothetical protein
MSDKKTININTAYFTSGKTRKNQTRSKKPKPLSIISPNDLKRNLIRKVKEHQKHVQQSFNPKSNHIENTERPKDKQNKGSEFFPDEFRESLDYLLDLSKEKTKSPIQPSSSRTSSKPHTKARSPQSKTFYNAPSTFSMDNIDIQLPHSSSQSSSSTHTPTPTHFYHKTPPQTRKNDTTHLTETIRTPSTPSTPQYGCLKNGKKPTYRTYMKTLKNRSFSPGTQSQKQNGVSINSTNITNTNSKTQNIPTLFNLQSQREKREKHRNKKTKTVTKQIKTRRYKCGKNKKTRKVGVILKSGKMRSRVLSETQTIKARPYHLMKNDLYKKGLLKIGSNAPKPLITEIYSNCIMTGDVKNKNKDVLIHNYMNDKSEL